MVAALPCTRPAGQSGLVDLAGTPKKPVNSRPCARTVCALQRHSSTASPPLAGAVACQDQQRRVVRSVRLGPQANKVVQAGASDDGEHGFRPPK